MGQHHFRFGRIWNEPCFDSGGPTLSMNRPEYEDEGIRSYPQ